MKKKTFTRRDMLLRSFRGFRKEDAPTAPSGLDALHLSADKALRRGEYRAALDGYLECLRRDPDDRDAMRRLALCRYKTGELEEARDAFAGLLETPPDDSFARLYLGLTHAARGDLDQARDVWKTYFNLEQPLILREINLQLALMETAPPAPEEVVRCVEQAIEEQRRS